MEQDFMKHLSQDPDGLLTYEYIANNIGACDVIMPDLVNNMIRVDTTGQFVASAARYLNAIDAVKYADSVKRLVASAIEKDRERRYLPDLIEALYGADYADKAPELIVTDDNFRRLYKRVALAQGI